MIGYEDSSDLQALNGELAVDMNRMTDTLLLRPLGDILDAVDVDVEAAIRGQTQTGLSAFC